MDCCPQRANANVWPKPGGRSKSPNPRRWRSKTRKSSCDGWHKRKFRTVLVVSTVFCGSWRIFHRIVPPRCVRIRRCCLAQPAESHRNGHEVLHSFEKMAPARQGYARLGPCLSGCEGSPSTDRFTGWPTFGLSFASVCQQCQAYTECKLFPDLDTAQEPAY
jgi:hypothetical protein